MCQDSRDMEDKPTATPSLLPNPRLWSPKTRRLEVNVIPRPRPSPMRPRIDPWSFVSAGGAGGTPGGGHAPARRSESQPLGYHHPSSTNPFAGCHPFPSPDCDPFALRGAPDPQDLEGPNGGFGGSAFDPFSPPFPTTSRSAPCSANGSPTLPTARLAAPFHATADSAALIDLGGWAAYGGRPLDGARERARPRRTMGLKPFKSPSQLRDDRF